MCSIDVWSRDHASGLLPSCLAVCASAYAAGWSLRYALTVNVSFLTASMLADTTNDLAYSVTAVRQGIDNRLPVVARPGKAAATPCGYIET